jgi:hypothetical protein
MWQVGRSVRHAAESRYREAVATGRLVQPHGQLAVFRRRKVRKCGLMYGTSARASLKAQGEDHFPDTVRTRSILASRCNALKGGDRGQVE